MFFAMDLKTIQILLGHQSLSITSIFTKVSMRLKREVYEQAHPRAKLKKKFLTISQEQEKKEL